MRGMRSLSRSMKTGLGVGLVALLGVGAGQSVQMLEAAAKKSDTTAPSVAISFPLAGRAYRAATWSDCARVGICGTASDATGVGSVELSILQQSGGMYWNGTAFVSSSTPILLTASGTTSWVYGLARPADGAYTVSVWATDTALVPNRSGSVTAMFSVDTAPPSPAPLLTSHPDDVTSETTATFAFSGPEAGVAYRCQLDGAAAAACGSPVTYKNLSNSQHTLAVSAVDAAGNVSPPASWTWMILVNKPFTITDATDPTRRLLFPGSSAALNVNIKNPYNFPLRVTGISIAAITSNRTACDPATNLVPVPAVAVDNVVVVVPANSTWSLDSLGVLSPRWPQLQMQNLGSDQEACKNAIFTLTYSGTGTK